MASGSCTKLSALPAGAGDIVATARRAVLATVDGSGRPHAVPICFAVRSEELVTAVDDKPKSPRELARVKHIKATGRATMMVDRWSEDWTRLGWVMVGGPARIDYPGSAEEELSARYEQYRGAPPRGDVIAVTPEIIRWWTWE
jgi:PPOX class probable F420-dependent enzyme